MTNPTPKQTFGNLVNLLKSYGPKTLL